MKYLHNARIIIQYRNKRVLSRRRKSQFKPDNNYMNKVYIKTMLKITNFCQQIGVGGKCWFKIKHKVLTCLIFAQVHSL